MLSLDVELGPEELESGFEKTLLKVDELNKKGREGVSYMDLLRSLEKKMGDNVAAIIHETERRGLIRRGEAEFRDGNKVCPLWITTEGRERLERIKKIKKQQT